ncbi:unnamed protein product [Protopolystoma xenopodis]|uniref:Uncharacterized protein n=1 Tax=Protopolystoma xenopodis TaxID=117903 RepID=A0A448WE61_9PLAT|nr:unnamed protein product [Protopolystoma xenopodis]
MGSASVLPSSPSARRSSSAVSPNSSVCSSATVGASATGRINFSLHRLGNQPSCQLSAQSPRPSHTGSVIASTGNPNTHQFIIATTSTSSSTLPVGLCSNNSSSTFHKMAGSDMTGPTQAASGIILDAFFALHK